MLSSLIRDVKQNIRVFCENFVMKSRWISFNLLSSLKTNLVRRNIGELLTIRIIPKTKISTILILFRIILNSVSFIFLIFQERIKGNEKYKLRD
jgi:hypothetical protein